MIRTKAAQLLATCSLLTGTAPTFAQQLEHAVPPPTFPPPPALPAFDLLWFASMLVVVAVIFMAMRYANERDKNRQELIAKFIDKGDEIPSFLLPQPPSPRRELRRGVLLAGVGVGLGAALYIVSGDWRVAAWSLIPLCLAAASLLNATLFSEPGSRQ
jgi:hypothetical protein